MIGQHSQIAAGLETYWFDIDWSATHTPAWQTQISRIASLYEVDSAVVFELAGSAACAEEFLDRFMSMIAERQQKPRWAEKTPGNVARIERILHHWPSAKIVHIIRDPRDVYASMVQSGKMSRPDEFIDRWQKIMPAAFEQAAAPLARDNVLQVRYENLVRNPEQTMRSAMEFIGEPFESEVAQYAGSEQDFDKVLKITGKVSTTLDRMKDPINLNRLNLWPEVIGEAGARELFAAADKCGVGPLMRDIAANTPETAK